MMLCAQLPLESQVWRRWQLPVVLVTLARQGFTHACVSLQANLTNYQCSFYSLNPPQ